MYSLFLWGVLSGTLPICGSLKAGFWFLFYLLVNTLLVCEVSHDGATTGTVSTKAKQAAHT